MNPPSPSPGFVVDCSVSAAWIFEEQADAYTESALDALAQAPALAPAWWRVEMVNVLLMLEKRGRLSATDAVQALRMLERLPVQTEDRASSAFDLHALARRHQLTSYDALYLDVALARGLPIATRDKALARAAVDSGIGVWAPENSTTSPALRP